MANGESQDWVERLDQLVLDWLWAPERPAEGAIGAGVQTLRVTYTAARDSLRNRLPFQASALTFISLLSLVPALAISFSIAKGLGFGARLRSLILDNKLTAGQGEILGHLLNYVDRTQVGTLGAVGLAALVITLIFTLSSVEETFNRIWGVREMRSWPRKFSDYLSVLIISPLLIVTATTAWAGFSSVELVRWLLEMKVVGEVARTGMKLFPLLTLCVGFVFMYQFLPNTRIPWASAIIGGLCAAVLWWLVQSVYIFFQVGVARYNAIYGGFASLPLFMVWMQVSWTVLLFGAQLAHAYHVCRLGRRPGETQVRLTPAQEESVGLRLMYQVAASFHQGGKPPSVGSIARDLATPASGVRQAADRLIDSGILNEDCEKGFLRPSRSLDTIMLGQVLATLRGEGQAGKPDFMPEPLRAALESTRAAGGCGLGEVSILDLVKPAGGKK